MIERLKKLYSIWDAAERYPCRLNSLSGLLLLAIVVAFLKPQTASASATASLAIRIEDISPLGGVLRLGVYDEASYPDDNSKPVASADVAIFEREKIITLRDIAPGEYAIEAFQDINRNGKMDTSWIGLPEEPFGFSRDARPGLGKPSFTRVKFALIEGENTQVIHLQTGIALFH